jgi:hypothetical protein
MQLWSSGIRHLLHNLELGLHLQVKGNKDTFFLLQYEQRVINYIYLEIKLIYFQYFLIIECNEIIKNIAAINIFYYDSNI